MEWREDGLERGNGPGRSGQERVGFDHQNRHHYFSNWRSRLIGSGYVCMSGVEWSGPGYLV